MFEKLDSLSQQAWTLTQTLIRETPPGQAFNTASPVYQQLQAALLETQEHVKQLEADAIGTFHQDIASLKPVAAEAVPADGLGAELPESQEGEVTFRFEEAHQPDEAYIREQIAALAARVHAHK